MKVTAILCTRNRAADLRATLLSIAAVELPAGSDCQLLVVDNASTDETSAVVKAADGGGMRVRYAREDRPGKCHALNTALALAHGDVLLFTDDDVRLPPGWLAGMCQPIWEGRADAVAGGVRLAPHLLRAWMEPVHRSWLAGTDLMDLADPQNMVGANMAFARRVLEKVPGFDPALGPAGTGAGEEMLFSWQLKRAGFRIVAALDVEVEHHFQPHRLRREHFLRLAENRGRTNAYLAHHWRHELIPHPHHRLLRARARLAWHRLRRRGEWPHTEGMPAWEMSMVEHAAFFAGTLVERATARRYGRMGNELRMPAGDSVSTRSPVRTTQ